MCEGWNAEVSRGAMGMEYCDEQSWKRLDLALLEPGERAELERINKTGVLSPGTKRRKRHGEVGSHDQRK